MQYLKIVVIFLILASTACTSTNSTIKKDVSNENTVTKNSAVESFMAGSQIELVDSSEVSVDVNWYVDEISDFLFVVGSVTNNSVIPISGMVQFFYYDKDNNPIRVNALEIAESDKVTFSAPIAPGDVGYFRRTRDLTNLSGAVARIEASIAYAVAENVSPIIEFSDIVWASTNGRVDIEGKMHNVSQVACNSPSVVAAFIDGETLVDVKEYLLDTGVLEKDSSISFAYQIYRTPTKFDEVRLAIQCAPSTFPRP